MDLGGSKSPRGEADRQSQRPSVRRASGKPGSGESPDASATMALFHGFPAFQISLLRLVNQSYSF